jgi:hypothetical protein
VRLFFLQRKKIMTITMWRAITFFSLALLLHSCISAVQYISLHGEIPLPMDITVECIVACILGSFAFVKSTVDSYKWKNINLAKNYYKVSMEQINTRPDFYHFNTRAKALYGHGNK